MDFQNTNDSVTRRVRAFTERVARLKEHDLYYLNMPVEEILPDSKVLLRGRTMGMYASYSYLGLVGHPRINEAAKKAVDKFGTGTNGVRMLAGTLTIHKELEETIAEFKHAEAAVTYSSGYVTKDGILDMKRSKVAYFDPADTGGVLLEFVEPVED